MDPRSQARVVLILVLFVSAGCGRDEGNRSPQHVTSLDLGSSRIFFGHQSVGRNILDGIREIKPRIRIETLDDAESRQGPMLVESTVGRNGDPASKDRDFLRAVDKLGSGDFALLKYCYVDMTPDTDPEELYRTYAATLDSARALGVNAIAVTMPITAIDPDWKRLAKRILGRGTTLELNARRQAFNDLLRDRFGPDQLVDIAHLESTLPDGTRSTQSFEGSPIETLPKEFTGDGSHLNELGRRHVAAGFLEALVQVTGSTASP
jgi:hypothetical protein